MTDDHRPARNAGQRAEDLEEGEGECDSVAIVYKICVSLGAQSYGSLPQQPVEQLAQAIAQVVAIEGPVHVEEAARRIRTLWGVKRSGQRILSAINRGIYQAEQNGLVRRRGDFLWPPIDRAVKVRRRVSNPTPRIDFICDEEIGEAVKLALEVCSTTTADDLIVQSSQLLGVQPTNSLTATRIRSVIFMLIQRGELQRHLNGGIQFMPGKAAKDQNI
jgi:hypothetical protein